MVAAGIPEELYWRLTPREIYALIEQMTARTKAENKAAAARTASLIAAIYNVNRKSGTPAFQASDFMHKEPEIVNASEARHRLLGMLRA